MRFPSHVQVSACFRECIVSSRRVETWQLDRSLGVGPFLRDSGLSSSAQGPEIFKSLEYSKSLSPASHCITNAAAHLSSYWTVRSQPDASSSCMCLHAVCSSRCLLPGGSAPGLRSETSSLDGMVTALLVRVARLHAHAVMLEIKWNCE